MKRNWSRPRCRASALAAEGVTTVEIKSGYGLTLGDELKMLRVARRLGRARAGQRITTLLAAHAVPPEYAGRGRRLHRPTFATRSFRPRRPERLADAVDVFCEGIAFSPAQCGRVFEAAARHGLPVKGHVEQLSNLGGAQLAAQFQALSVDHLEHLDARRACRRIAAVGHGGRAVAGGILLSPRDPQKPPVELLRAAGVPMAVASDLNPGTSPLASLRLMLNMAARFSA